MTDAPAVGAILHAAIAGKPWLVPRWSEDEMHGHAALMIARGWVTVARSGPQVTGFIARDGADVHALYAARPGQGVGRRLLRGAKARGGKLSLWTYQADADARRFYLREGFAEAEQSAGAGNDDGLPDVRYVWDRTDSGPPAGIFQEHGKRMGDLRRCAMRCCGAWSAGLRRHKGRIADGA